MGERHTAMTSIRANHSRDDFMGAMQIIHPHCARSSLRGKMGEKKECNGKMVWNSIAGQRKDFQWPFLVAISSDGHCGQSAKKVDSTRLLSVRRLVV